ncbi:hypothetical protein INT47_012227 [Mucor saturninus]|uniref:Uncharacterized protein n=1 Tax=Mucor saturninus TaxID=64648 RepID=A0A8H7VAF2_9FUNG|nr:hypothetical protein INT47_012227 [Mucor saturninus]
MARDASMVYMLGDDFKVMVQRIPIVLRLAKGDRAFLTFRNDPHHNQVISPLLNDDFNNGTSISAHPNNDDSHLKTMSTYYTLPMGDRTKSIMPLDLFGNGKQPKRAGKGEEYTIPKLNECRDITTERKNYKSSHAAQRISRHLRITQSLDRRKKQEVIDHGQNSLKPTLKLIKVVLIGG